jgi:hypothetical protein
MGRQYSTMTDRLRRFRRKMTDKVRHESLCCVEWIFITKYKHWRRFPRIHKILTLGAVMFLKVCFIPKKSWSTWKQSTKVYNEIVLEEEQKLSKLWKVLE